MDFKKPEEKQESKTLEITFSTFVFSLATATLMSLGEVDDPTTNQKTVNLDLAKQNIDILGMMHDKSKGNLTPEEETLIESILRDLRLKFVEKSK